MKDIKLNFSVNVFLGLGLPWLIRSVYSYVRDESFKVSSTSIDFAVYLFDAFGLVCIVLLIFRYGLLCEKCNVWSTPEPCASVIILSRFISDLSFDEGSTCL